MPDFGMKKEKKKILSNKIIPLLDLWTHVYLQHYVPASISFPFKLCIIVVLSRSARSTIYDSFFSAEISSSSDYLVIKQIQLGKEIRSLIY
jgi:hypothetical protein